MTETKLPLIHLLGSSGYSPELAVALCPAEEVEDSLLVTR